MSLNDCMQKVTNREYRLWMLWFDSEWNKPDRTDHYLMQIAAQIVAVNSKETDTVLLSDFKIPFETKKEKVSNTVEKTAEQLEQEKRGFSQRFIAGFKKAFGGKVKVVTKEQAPKE